MNIINSGQRNMTANVGSYEKLLEFKMRMDHIKAMQFKWYNGPYMMGEMVAYFDVRQISEDEVKKIIHEGMYDDRVVTVYRGQAEKVFGYNWLDCNAEGDLNES